MAEIITILGVASSIVQLIDSVAKLKGLCGTYKDASADLADLVFEINISAKHLDKSREQFEKASLLDCDLVADCLDYLGQALLAINVVSAEIQKALISHKRIGAMKFVWKSEQIQKLRRKLERAQKLLDRTERLTDRAERELAASEQSRQLQAIQFSNELLARALHLPQIGSQHTSTGQYNCAINTSPLGPQLALESLGKTSLAGSPRPSKGREYRISLPQWLWSKVLCVVFERQASSISCSLHYDNVHPWGGELDLAIRKGDIDTVKSLFISGKATPSDVRDCGVSFLGLAAFRCHSKLCRFLISQGAKIDRVSPRGDTFTDEFAACLSNGPIDMGLDDFDRNMQDIFNLLTVSLPFNDRDFENDGRSEFCPFTSLVYNGGLGNARSLSLEARANLVLQCTSPLLIDSLLGPDLSFKEALRSAAGQRPRHRGLLHEILVTPAGKRYHWSSIASELIVFERSLHIDVFKNQVDSGVFCPNILFSTGYGDQRLRDVLDNWQTPESLNRVLQERLSYLQTLGADLLFMGQVEHILLRPEHILLQPDMNIGPYFYPLKIVHLDTGPRPENWKIWFAPGGWEYEWAGDFWHRIENPEMFMPGSYLDRAEADWEIDLRLETYGPWPSR